jgi:hypothetical protein
LFQKRHKPFSSYEDTSLQAKTLPRISKPKQGHNYAKQDCICEQELSEDRNARLFLKLSQVCFIVYNNVYLYEYIKLSQKVQRLVIKMFYQVNHCLIIMNAWNCSKKSTNPSVVMEIPAYKQKLDQEFLSLKRCIIMKKKIRIMGLVPIMLNNHREQVCEVSIHSIQ